MLKARTVQSEETRKHLRDAHQRVMSVATVQQQLQLQPSGLGDRIEVGPSRRARSVLAKIVAVRRRGDLPKRVLPIM